MGTGSDPAMVARDLSWMVDLCNKDRESLRQPFEAEHDGAKWAVATDGHGLVMVREAGAFPARASAPPIGPLFSSTAKLHMTTERGALLDWLGPLTAVLEKACFFCGAPARVPCRECHGNGQVLCNLGEYHECEPCGGAGFNPCNHDGVVDSSTVNKGRFGATIINRALARRLLDRVADGRIEIWTEGEWSPVRFQGAGWVVFVMAMQIDSAEVRAAVPVFSGAGDAV